MSDCTHIHLVKLEGPMNEDGKSYRCQDCPELFRVELLEIKVSYGRPDTASA